MLSIVLSYTSSTFPFIVSPSPTTWSFLKSLVAFLVSPTNRCHDLPLTCILPLPRSPLSSPIDVTFRYPFQWFPFSFILTKISLDRVPRHPSCFFNLSFHATIRRIRVNCYIMSILINFYRSSLMQNVFYFDHKLRVS